MDHITPLSGILPSLPSARKRSSNVCPSGCDAQRALSPVPPRSDLTPPFPSLIMVQSSQLPFGPTNVQALRYLLTARCCVGLEISHLCLPRGCPLSFQREPYPIHTVHSPLPSPPNSTSPRDSFHMVCLDPCFPCFLLSPPLSWKLPVDLSRACDRVHAR